ncbi:HDOD domain-containing protein [Paramaledivibacter caminithermalis]|jgi:HD-like signal output (HDOD) protein|uniref:Stage 0 sporulation protein A homolog n=1 Tax=Paramaledivibacter caminithermalis (strain DSM 15212 / CIP 107654 / DViRD3) TaxID=1121301 RepID=A0A1M6JNS6_PARC5|nr:HDOD domain-containing protein [Paramaledivibacter caminithermalis]SHJ48399.1 Response regulator containing CheY-like receiver, AAA-type ATPase, and DNA-binding domains [Paramaledivibacter caminithermalis DSM 15212]
MNKILIVDDEIQILRSFRRLFLESNYEAYFANNGLEALEILENKQIDLIITDIRMPNMNGYELLEEVKKRHPKVLRMVISGYTDGDRIYKALENGLAKLYLLKPWENSTIIEILDKAFKVEEILKNKKIFELINNIGNLPSIPKLYNEINFLITKDSNIDKIADIIEKDQAIASRILRISNSIYPKKEIGSVKQGIIYLGLSIVKNIVLTNSVFDNSRINPYIQELLWTHSSMTNNIMLMIYEELLNKKLINAYKSAGLLHDIGWVVLLENFKEKYTEIIKNINENDDSNISEVERRFFGCSHEEIGGYLLDWWELPYPIVESALFHNTPLDSRVINKELVCIVHISSYYSWKLVNGDSFFKRKLNEDVFEFLGISLDRFEMLFDNLQKNTK